MLKELFFRLIDLLDAVLFEPFRVENAISGWGDSPLKLAKGLVLFFAALSASTANVLISPPYTNQSGTFLVFGFGFYLSFFYLLPYPLAFILDGLAQKKDRKANSKILLQTIRLGISVFLPAAAWSVILSLFGLTGKPGVVLLFLIHYGVFLVVIVRATMYLYDLKFRDALAFNLTTFVITFFFPLIMYLTLGISFAPSSQ